MIKYLNIFIWLCLSPIFLVGQNHVILSGGNLVQSGGTIVIKDANLVNNATIDQSSGSVKISGTAADAQSQIGGTSTTEFHTLEIAKTSNNATLGQSVIINNSLLMNGGLLDLQASNLTILATGDISNADATKYIRTSGLGTLIRTVGNSNISFPVGSSNYNLLTMLNNGTQDVYSIRVFDGLLQNGETGANITEKGVGASWVIDESNAGGSDLTFGFNWNGTQELTNFDRSNMTAIHHDGFSWSQVGSTGSATGTDPYAFSAMGINDLSVFALASLNDNCLLPGIETCMDITIDLDAGGNVSITPMDVNNGNSDVCTIVTSDVTPNSFTCADIGPNDVTLTLTNNLNVTSSCMATVTVEDNMPPVITCADATVEVDANGEVTITHATTFTGSSDNCGFIGLYPLAQELFTCADVGPNNVTISGFDGNGNDGDCTAIVTVEDNLPPVITCADATVSLDINGEVTITHATTFTGSSDNCGFIGLYPLAQDLFTCADIGPNLVIISGFDGNGNDTDCAATVTVFDDMPPVITCADATVSLDVNGEVTITHATTFTGSSDNCGFIGLYPLAQDLFTCTDIGPHSVTISGFDGNGNDTDCTATVTVVDDMLPVVTCQNITISLNNQGDFTITPNDIFDAANSSDNCGTINLVSISKSLFTCQNEGANIVTLTANDGNGNTQTCNATVTVNPFITNISISSTPESCAGAGDGSISISATAGGGQLQYSIDGGANFTPSGTFNNLTPGSYNLVIKVLGIPNICVKTATEIVAAGGTAQVWYKDSDGDTYSDGTTTTSCTQPAGYIASPSAGTDCNDNDPTINPGTTEICDGLDNNCDGVLLVGEVDADGDGYMVCEGDCDDGNASVNPGATEICDGLDNDCDGNIDEGVSSGQTYAGNVTFTSQTDVDAWLACYSIIDGSLTVAGYNITSLANMTGLEEVTGSVNIYYNSSLTSLDGLDNLALVGGSLSVFYNFSLNNCCAIYNLINGGVTGTISIFFNATGCNSTTEINTNCNPNPLVQTPNSISFESHNTDKQPNMELFPNPVSNELNVVTSGFSHLQGSLIVTDNLGRIVWMQDVNEIENGQFRINTSKLPVGVYSLSLRARGTEEMIKRFVKISN